MQVTPVFGVLHFKDLDLSADGGSVKSIHETIGVQLKWGDALKGWVFQYEIANGYVTSGASTSFTETDLSLDIFKLRHFYSIIDDMGSQMALFFSVGQIMGHYKVINSTEGSGITNYIVRNLDAYLADIGVVFGYELNQDWLISLNAAYQFSFEANLTNLAGQKLTSPSLDFSGAMIQLGSSFRL